MEKIFATARLDNVYNLVVRREGNGHLHVTLETGATGHTIVLSGYEVTGFIAAIAELQAPVQPEAPNDDGVPPHEPSVCGNAYLAAERALRIIENATKLGEGLEADALQQVVDLAHEAGAACNRLALRRDALADDLPF